MSELVRQSQRIDALLDEIADRSTAHTMSRIAELVAALVDLYGDGLARVVRRLEALDLDRAQLAGLLGDELVTGLLVLHDIHPLAVDERIERALETVRPELGDGAVALAGVAGEVLTLRLAGLAAAARPRIEAAVAATAPEITRIDYVEERIRTGGEQAPDRVHLPILEEPR